MNREEAIIQIKDLLSEGRFLDKDKEALDMAISALSTEGEYIRKTDIINQIANVEDYVSDGKVYICLGEAINNISSMQGYSFPDREKGEWIPFVKDNSWKVCSVCGALRRADGFDDYCSACGSDMRGKANE